MFRWIFLCVIIPEAILVASSNYNNGLWNTSVTVNLENNDTPIKHPTTANVIRKWLARRNVEDTSIPNNSHNVDKSNDGEDERITNLLSFPKVGNDQEIVVFKKILGRWISLMKNKSNQSINQFPVLKANDPYKILSEGNLVDKSSSTNQEQLSNKGNNIISTSKHFVPRPWWMQSRIGSSSTEIENVHLTTEPQESLLLKKENGKETKGFNKIASNVENNLWKTELEESEEILPIPVQPIPERWVKQYTISNMILPNFKNNTTSTDSSSMTQRIVALEANKQKTQPTAATQESNFKNWDLLILGSKINKLFEEEHDHLENELKKNKKQPETISLTPLESAEGDDERSKALRKKVESWFGNLQSRRELANMGISPEMGKTVRLRRNIESVLAALSQTHQISEWQRFHAVDNQNKWRRQLLNQYSMPEAVDYRRLLSLWQKELRRQLNIKWNRRPLVEISPGAFKTDIYVNPPDDLAKHMQKLLALKKRQEERNRDLNAGKENAE